MTPFPCLLLVILLCVAGTSNGARIATIPCGGTIPIDSQYNLSPLWSLAAFRDTIASLSGGGMTFIQQPINKALENFLVSESGLNVGSTLIFEIAPGSSVNGASSVSQDEETICSAAIDPLKGGMSGVTSRSARFTVLRVGDAAGAMCSLPLNVSIVTSDQRSATTLVFDNASSVFAKSVSFGVAESGTWPLTISFNSRCALQFILVVDRYGAINRWYVWIPTTVYTAIVVALFLPILALRRQLPVHLAGVFLFLVFLGFLGSCIGLIVELILWQSALGRFFPFPPSVTLYSCLCVLYALLLLPVLFRQGNNTVLFMGVIRLLTYGLNCALCVGYWIAGYVVLGSLAAFQLLVTNFILTWYYAYVSVHLRRALRGTVSLPKFSSNFLYLWCAPVTPFACCALMYYDLYLLAQRDIKKDMSAVRMRDVVRLYNAQLSLPLLLSQNVCGIALLATATAFHMPFVVILFVALLLWLLHIVLAIGEYGREWSRWRRCGGSTDTCGRISLSAAMKSLLSTEAASLPSASPAFRQSLSPSPGSVRRRGQPSQYEEDIAAYRGDQPPSSTSSEDSGFDDRLQHRPHRRIPEQTTAFSTPSRQNISDAPEYWPSSVER